MLSAERTRIHQVNSGEFCSERSSAQTVIQQFESLSVFVRLVQRLVRTVWRIHEYECSASIRLVAHVLQRFVSVSHSSGCRSTTLHFSLDSIFSSSHTRQWHSSLSVGYLIERLSRCARASLSRKTPTVCFVYISHS